ncbi:MAG TPA: ATP-binding protein, partial [Acidobacteriaceae bacterium]|nr:ATP-binding protein [Acidobacteriaceae bacterium]
IIEEVRRELEPETRNRVIRWRIEELPPALADQPMLRQVIENLLGNALKFTRNRSVAEIRIGTQTSDDGSLVVCIEDNGAGFDMSYYDKLFQVFQRLHGEDEFEGTGIGLANVRRIIERHGGAVWAEGAVDQGAKFYFSLPEACDGKGETHELAETHSAG